MVFPPLCFSSFSLKIDCPEHIFNATSFFFFFWYTFYSFFWCTHFGLSTCREVLLNKKISLKPNNNFKVFCAIQCDTRTWNAQLLGVGHFNVILERDRERYAYHYQCATLYSLQYSYSDIPRFLFCFVSFLVEITFIFLKMVSFFRAMLYYMPQTIASLLVWSSLQLLYGLSNDCMLVDFFHNGRIFLLLHRLSFLDLLVKLCYQYRCMFNWTVVTSSSLSVMIRVIKPY